MNEDKGVEVSTASAAIPQYVLDHAPLVYLHSTDPYRPSSLAAQLTHTHPELDSKALSNAPSPLTLSNLGDLNALGPDGGKNIYLTSNDDVTTNPKWLEGIQPDKNGGTGDAKTSVIVVVDKGNGVVDAFYFYFYAFNWGGVVLGKQLGDHVGDWEHNMIRFTAGVPQSIWLSQHSTGSAYTFAALNKDPTGKRPLVFAATGSHALYPTPGTHDHTLPNLPLPFPLLLVDHTDAGPLYDPLRSALYYAYTPATRTFTPSDARTPTSFLSFNGKWGDAAYPADDARQKGKGLFGFAKYVGGPTGPADKQLDRKDVWPESRWSVGQRVRTGLGGGRWVGDCFGVGRMVRARRERKRGLRRVDVSGEEVVV